VALSVIIVISCMLVVHYYIIVGMDNAAGDVIDSQFVVFAVYCIIFVPLNDCDGFHITHGRCIVHNNYMTIVLHSDMF